MNAPNVVNPPAVDIRWMHILVGLAICVFLFVIGGFKDMGWIRDIGIVAACVLVAVEIPHPDIRTIFSGVATFYAVMFLAIPLFANRILLENPATREALNKRGVYSDLQVAELATPPGAEQAQLFATARDTINASYNRRLYAELDKAVARGDKKRIKELRAEAGAQVDWNREMSLEVLDLGDRARLPNLDIAKKPFSWRLMAFGISALATMLTLSILGLNKFGGARLVSALAGLALFIGMLLFFIPETSQASDLIPGMGSDWKFVRKKFITQTGAVSEGKNESVAEDIVITADKISFDYKSDSGEYAHMDLTSTDRGINYSGTVSRPGDTDSPVSLKKQSGRLYIGMNEFIPISLVRK